MEKKVDIYIAYEIERSVNIVNISSNSALENCLFYAVKLRKHDNDIDLYKCSGYGIGFDRKRIFSSQ